MNLPIADYQTLFTKAQVNPVLPVSKQRTAQRATVYHFQTVECTDATLPINLGIVPGWGLEQHRDISINGQRQDCSSQLNNIPATHEIKRIQQYCTEPSSRCLIPNFDFFNTRKQPLILLWK